MLNVEYCIVASMSYGVIPSLRSIWWYYPTLKVISTFLCCLWCELILVFLKLKVCSQVKGSYFIFHVSRFTIKYNQMYKYISLNYLCSSTTLAKCIRGTYLCPINFSRGTRLPSKPIVIRKVTYERDEELWNIVSQIPSHPFPTTLPHLLLVTPNLLRLQNLYILNIVWWSKILPMLI